MKNLSALLVTGALALGGPGCVHHPSSIEEAAALGADPLGRPGYVTKIEDGRLWVFEAKSESLAAYEKGGELAKHVTYVSAGPSGRTIKGPDRETVLGYLASKPGFVTLIEDGRLWVFLAGSEELAAYQKGGELAKHVTLIGQGPLGSTVKTPDKTHFQLYQAYKPGFNLRLDDGRLWVFRAGSESTKQFDAGEEFAKHVTRVGGGPGGLTLKSDDTETLNAYLVHQPGFVTEIDEDGRLWVFEAGSEELEAYRKIGSKPEKHITLVGAGPLGMTVKAPSRETAQAYLRN